jgi:hypothetical protein
MIAPGSEVRDFIKTRDFVKTREFAKREKIIQKLLDGHWPD